MNISIPLEKGELTAEIKGGELIGYKAPTITDINENPDKCLRFMLSIVEAIKVQRELGRSGEIGLTNT